MLESSNLFITTSNGGYALEIDTNNFGRSVPNENSIWVVDTKVSQLHHELFTRPFVKQEAIETEKCLSTVEKLIEQIREGHGTRDTQIVAVGGGIIQDLVTFTASSYMRGVQWTYCPTTLLGMVDSCIGGKSSLNVGRFKNIAGNFYPPKQIIIDTQFCQTLSEVQIIEGLCEAAKISYAASDEAFQLYLKLFSDSGFPGSNGHYSKLIAHSLLVKKGFIEQDEFDRGIRQILNLGHTFGHAIEGATSYAISHGVAVGLGILAANHFSVRLGLVDAKLPSLCELNRHIKDLLKGVPGLIGTLQNMDATDSMECFSADKKHSQSAFSLILFDRMGRPHKVNLPRDKEVSVHLRATFECLKELDDEVQ